MRLGHCEGSHRAGIGGVTLAAANGTTGRPLDTPTFTLEQSLANGTVGFALRALPRSAPLLQGTILSSQSSDGGSATTLVTTITGGREPIGLTWSTWTWCDSEPVSGPGRGAGQAWWSRCMDRSGGAGVSGGTRDDGVAFATRLLNGTARPVTGVIVSSLSAGERVRRPRASTAAAAHSSADCSSRMPGQWRVTGTPQPVTLQHSAGAPAGSFFWNTSSAGGKGWKLASGTAYPNGSIAFDYHRVVPAGCSAPACGPPTPTGCVCQFVGAFDVGSCDRFTLNNEHWTQVRRPHNRVDDRNTVRQGQGQA